MEIITYDESGEFRTDLFCEVTIPLFVSEPDEAGREDTGLIASLGNGVERYVHADSIPTWDREFACPGNPRHQTKLRFREASVDLFGGPVVGDFVHDSLLLIVAGQFVDRLTGTGLSGVEFLPLAINENQSDANPGALFRLAFTSKDCTRKKTVRIPEGNACPFCGFIPIICPDCGDISYECPACQEDVIVPRRKHGGAADRRHFITPIPREGRIVEGMLWDGSDFLHDGMRMIATRRTVNWLLSVHATPFVARPRRVNVAGATPEQLERLERAKEGQAPFQPL